MKRIIPSLLCGALLAGVASAATTTPVGYYMFDGYGGGNIFVPSFVNAASFAGSLSAASGTTLTLAANSLTAGAYDQGPIYKTHYVEITSGPNAGVNVDIVSNTASTITLSSSIAALSLTGTETIVIRRHVTLRSSLAGAEALLNVYTDSATFYSGDGSFQSYIYGADGGTGWSSDFVTADGNDRPVPPGTGFVLGLLANVDLPITGEVKAPDVVVQLPPGVVNIVGPVNPLVGDTISLNDVGFGALEAFTDSVTILVPGSLLPESSYIPLGDGTMSEDFVTPTTEVMNYTTGAIVITAGYKVLSLHSGLLSN